MRTLLLGDIHHKWELAEEIIAQIPHDTVVFVGDYFDDFGDSRKKAKRTALWLKESLTKPNRIHLIGNHDLAYREIRTGKCPGWTDRKAAGVAYILSPEDWAKLHFFVWIEDFLVSHAGVTINHLPAMTNNFQFWLNQENKKAQEALIGKGTSPKGPYHHWFWDCGFARGGDALKGGLVWCDWHDEFYATPFNQIVGHTPYNPSRAVNSHPIRRKWAKYEHFESFNFCIDCIWKAVMVIDSNKPNTPEIWERFSEDSKVYLLANPQPYVTPNETSL